MRAKGGRGWRGGSVGVFEGVGLRGRLAFHPSVVFSTYHVEFFFIFSGMGFLVVFFFSLGWGVGLGV